MNIVDFILSTPQRRAMPIAVYPGAHLTGATVRELVTDSEAQFAAIAALLRRYDYPFALTAMDLSVEAETFGAEVVFANNEVPTIKRRLIESTADIATLAIPEVADGRGCVQLDTIKKLAAMSSRPRYIVGGMCGPYTLAGRLFGVSEIMELTLLDVDAVHTLLAKTTTYLIKYVKAFKTAGADAVCMAEPAAGLLWPDGLKEFSSYYVQQIINEVEDDKFRIILHNCGCDVEHLDAILSSGATFLHFGNKIDISTVLAKAPSHVVISGNLDPMEFFVSASPARMRQATMALIEQTAGYRNFVLSSGCDIPPDAKLENLDAFHEASKLLEKL